MRSNDDMLKMLGFATRARKIAAGNLAVEMAVRKGKAKVVFYDEDMSENSFQKLKALCEGRGIPLIATDGGVLSKTIGKENIYVTAVTDQLFSRRIMEIVGNI